MTSVVGSSQAKNGDVRTVKKMLAEATEISEVTIKDCTAMPPGNSRVLHKNLRGEYLL
jgi:hypothetical protein